MNIGAKGELTKSISPSSRIFTILPLSKNLAIVIAMPTIFLLGIIANLHESELMHLVSSPLRFASQAPHESLASAMFIYERERVDDGTLHERPYENNSGIMTLACHLAPPSPG